MKFLAFETASGRCSAAISEGHEILATELITANSQQAENLPRIIAMILEKAKLGLSDINYIATTSGPGSFTGIRIGLSTALGLSMAASITPIIVSNFGIINYRIREQYRDFDYAVSLIDAYRGECYIEIFDKQSKSLAAPELASIEKIKNIMENLEGKIVCAGSGAVRIYGLVPNLITLPRFPFPDARIVCRLANVQLLKGSFSSKIEPLYIRLPDAKLPA